MSQKNGIGMGRKVNTNSSNKKDARGHDEGRLHRKGKLAETKILMSGQEE